jgi:hypothetical protein
MNSLKDLSNKISNLEQHILRLGNKLSIENIILQYKFKILPFVGTGNGNDFEKMFDISEIKNQNILLKSIKFIPYYTDDSEDLVLSDGTTETIPATWRVNRVFDTFPPVSVTPDYGYRLRVNGAQEFFSVYNVAYQYAVPPPDFQEDNIYQLFKNVQDINMNYKIQMPSTFLGTSSYPTMKIYLGVYIFSQDYLK